MILSLLRECFAEDYYNFAQTNQKVMFMVKRTILLVCLFIFPVSFSLASNDDDTLKNKIEIRGEALLLGRIDFRQRFLLIVSMIQGCHVLSWSL